MFFKLIKVHLLVSELYMVLLFSEISDKIFFSVLLNLEYTVLPNFDSNLYVTYPAFIPKGIVFVREILMNFNHKILVSQVP